MVPCTRVLQWLEEVGSELPKTKQIGDYVKSKLKRMLRETQDSQAAAHVSTAPPPRHSERSDVATEAARGAAA
eukprot:CAMPEP_0180512068 /NCGR_PEP_ID=MMETSP1036_2-20121128/51382_1 /TAXON_ID=632150 /ORGANISM="Azadinium spinosum, Strain 3D9" /LENGTH=72 /DNA_ID=CAMNT_0022523165 /DNA_START=1 /DNA_END=216 /DNA_ORIENTATION=+